MPMTVKIQVQQGKVHQDGDTTYRSGSHEVDTLTACNLAANDVIDLTEMQARLLHVIDLVTTYDLEGIDHPRLGDELNFHQIVPLMDNVQAMFNNMTSLDGVRFLTNEVAERIGISSMDFLRAIDATKKFRTSDGKPAWEKHINTIHDAHVEFIHAITPFVGVIQLRLMETSKAGDIIKQEIESVKTQVLKEIEGLTAGFMRQIDSLDEINAAQQKGLEAFERTQTTADKTIKKFVDESEKQIGEFDLAKDQKLADLQETIDSLAPNIERQAQFFRDEAGEHKWQAFRWLKATGVSLGFLLFYAGYLIFSEPADLGDNISLIVQLILARAIMLGALGSAIFMCARNYRSHQHNAVVNKHRENALKTYQAFLKEADESKDPATKAIILDYAAKCIYAPQETGYDKIGGGKDATLIDIRRILGKTEGE